MNLSLQINDRVNPNPDSVSVHPEPGLPLPGEPHLVTVGNNLRVSIKMLSPFAYYP